MAESQSYLVYHWQGQTPPHPDATCSEGPVKLWALDLTPEMLVGLMDSYSVMLRKLPNGTHVIWLDDRAEGRPFGPRGPC